MIAAAIINGFTNFTYPHLMEAERINVIATRLNDLDARTVELRRYL